MWRSILRLQNFRSFTDRLLSFSIFGFNAISSGCFLQNFDNLLRSLINLNILIGELVKIVWFGFVSRRYFDVCTFGRNCDLFATGWEKSAQAILWDCYFFVLSLHCSIGEMFAVQRRKVSSLFVFKIYLSSRKSFIFPLFCSAMIPWKRCWGELLFELILHEIINRCILVRDILLSSDRFREIVPKVVIPILFLTAQTEGISYFFLLLISMIIWISFFFDLSPLRPNPSLLKVKSLINASCCSPTI